MVSIISLEPRNTKVSQYLSLNFRVGARYEQRTTAPPSSSPWSPRILFRVQKTKYNDYDEHASGNMPAVWLLRCLPYLYLEFVFLCVCFLFFRFRIPDLLWRILFFPSRLDPSYTLLCWTFSPVPWRRRAAADFMCEWTWVFPTLLAGGKETNKGNPLAWFQSKPFPNSVCRKLLCGHKHVRGRRYSARLYHARYLRLPDAVFLTQEKKRANIRKTPSFQESGASLKVERKGNEKIVRGERREFIKKETASNYLKSVFAKFKIYLRKPWSSPRITTGKYRLNKCCKKLKNIKL